MEKVFEPDNDCVERYNQYMATHRSSVVLVQESNPLLDYVVDTFSCEKNAKLITKDTLLQRDGHNRSLVHYVGLFFGMDGLARLHQKKLLRLGDWYALDNDGLTPSHYSVFACAVNRTSAKKLLDKHDINAQNHFGDSFFDMALSVDPDGLGQHLAKRVFSYSPNLDDLHFWVSRGDLDKVKNIIGKDSNVILNFRDGDNKTPLHIAVIYGQIVLIQWLLEQDANINAIDDLGNTPMHYAVLSKDKAPVIKASLLSAREETTKLKILSYLNAHGLCVQKLLIDHHADLLCRNKDNSRAVDLFDSTDSTKAFLHYKTWRASQKYSDIYLEKHVTCANDVLQRFFGQILLGISGKPLQGDQFDCCQQLVSALINYLNEKYPGLSKSTFAFFQNRGIYHDELRKEILQKLNALNVDPNDEGQELPIDFRQNVAGYLLNTICKGPDGAQKKALWTIIQRMSDPNDDMMQYLAVFGFVCRRVMAANNKLAPITP